MKSLEKHSQLVDKNNTFRNLKREDFQKKFLKELRYLDKPQFRQLSDFAREILNSAPPGSTVVDLGAGDCKWKKIFSDCKYIGIDSTDGNPDCDYSQLDYIADITQKTSLPDNIADVAICIAVSGHVLNLWRFLKEKIYKIFGGSSIRVFLKSCYYFPNKKVIFL